MSRQCRHRGRGAQAANEQVGLPSSPRMAHQEGQPSAMLSHCSLKRNHCKQCQCAQKGGTSVSPCPKHLQGLPWLCPAPPAVGSYLWFQ